MGDFCLFLGNICTLFLKPTISTNIGFWPACNVSEYTSGIDLLNEYLYSFKNICYDYCCKAFWIYIYSADYDAL